MKVFLTAAAIGMAKILALTAAAANIPLKVTEAPPIPSSMILSNATKTDVCTPGYTDKVRRVRPAQRAAACLSAKPIVIREGKRATVDLKHICDGLTVDHVIPLSLGGSNDQDNLVARPDAEMKEKDRLENTLHRAVCKGQMDLDVARIVMWQDWGQRLGKWKPR